VEWMQQGTCRNMNTLFVESVNIAALSCDKERQDQIYGDCRRICRGCPVFEPCENYALFKVPRSDVSFMGGMSPIERRARQKELRDLSEQISLQTVL
jgi:hypothetical protein